MLFEYTILTRSLRVFLYNSKYKSPAIALAASITIQTSKCLKKGSRISPLFLWRGEGGEVAR
jgi:hypothetical protein